MIEKLCIVCLEKTCMKEKQWCACDTKLCRTRSTLIAESGPHKLCSKLLVHTCHCRSGRAPTLGIHYFAACFIAIIDVIWIIFLMLSLSQEYAKMVLLYASLCHMCLGMECDTNVAWNLIPGTSFVRKKIDMLALVEAFWKVVRSTCIYHSTDDDDDHYWYSTIMEDVKKWRHY